MLFRSEDVVAHMYMYDIHVLPEDAIKFANFIKSSCKALDKAVAELRNFKKSKKFKQLIVDINAYEEEADDLYKHAIRHLHTKENQDVMHVLVWSRIYERMANIFAERFFFIRLGRTRIFISVVPSAENSKSASVRRLS